MHEQTPKEHSEEDLTSVPQTHTSSCRDFNDAYRGMMRIDNIVRDNLNFDMITQPEEMNQTRSNEGARERRGRDQYSSGGAAEKFSRRNLIVASLAAFGSLTAAAAAFPSVYYSRMTYRKKYPDSNGDAVEIRVTEGASTHARQTLIALPESLRLPREISRETNELEARNWLFQHGGAWIDRIDMSVTIKSLRKEVIVNGAHIRPLRHRPPLSGALYIPLGTGGDGERSEIDLTGVNLDATQPVVRMMNKEKFVKTKLGEPLPLGGIYPDKQITLGPGDTVKLYLIAQAQQHAVDWELILSVQADGEPMDITIRNGSHPFRLTPLARRYQIGWKAERRKIYTDSGTTFPSENPISIVARPPRQLLKNWTRSHS
ncbi:hypothetical protein ACOQFL_13715 [Actinopolyspora sp. H202]|uniref:hypothetical protein n=1 Tax=Actinopolyspora sp. H202 TaxID=1500456 RepID=UPI003EE4622D